ncbi:MAG: hypothetical protein EOP05_20135, partial [Proteobacteria bacterium]
MVVLCGLQISKLSTKYSIKEFYPKNHPILNMTDEVENRFQLHSTPTFLAVLSLDGASRSSGSWLTPSNFEKLKSVTSQLGEVANVKNVTSLANVDIAVNVQNELRVGNLGESLPSSEWKKTVDQLPLL